MKIEVNNKVEELAEEIGCVYSGNDWLVVKKYILKYINPKHRTVFSKRNVKTKKHILNDFEEKVINFYENKFDVRLVLNEDKKHED